MDPAPKLSGGSSVSVTPQDQRAQWLRGISARDPATRPRRQHRCHDPALALPAYARAGDAGLDLLAAAPVTLAPGERELVPTGLRVAIPEGYAGLVLPRSGLALRAGVTVLNAPGLVDSGYRGEIGVLLINHGAAAVTLGRGERIAQLVIQPVARATLVEVRELEASPRGTGGFGSTGT